MKLDIYHYIMLLIALILIIDYLLLDQYLLSWGGRVIFIGADIIAGWMG